MSKFLLQPGTFKNEARMLPQFPTNLLWDKQFCPTIEAELLSVLTACSTLTTKHHFNIQVLGSSKLHREGAIIGHTFSLTAQQCLAVVQTNGVVCMCDLIL